jgi:hypothetical protein
MKLFEIIKSIHIHKYTDWSKTYIVIDSISGTSIVYNRRCKICGKVQQSTAKEMHLNLV